MSLWDQPILVKVLSLGILASKQVYLSLVFVISWSVNLLTKVNFCSQFLKQKRKKKKKKGFPKERRFAWLVDKTKEERQRGSSLCTSKFTLETDGKLISTFVVPGSRVRVAIPAIAQADVAVLVVDSTPMEFEQGLPHTTEFALLAYTFGVKELIVVVNKLDVAKVGYSSARFEEVKTALTKAFKRTGYNLQNVPIIPVSAVNGDNLVKKSSNTPWWTGKPLLSVLQGITITRNNEGSGRLILRSALSRGVGLGKVVQGKLRVGQIVTSAPMMITSKIETLEMCGKNVDEAQAGDVVGVTLAHVDAHEISKGDVIGDAKTPPRICVQFVARIVIVSHPSKIRAGYAPTLFCHTTNFPCTFAKLLSKTDKSKKKRTPDPEFLCTNDQAEVLMVPLKSVSLDSFESCAAMGRFAVRDMGKTIGVGFIRSVVFAKEEKKK